MLPPRTIQLPGADILPPPHFYLKQINLSEAVNIALTEATKNKAGETDAGSAAKQKPHSNARTIKAFISYSHKDADLLTQLHEHLSALQRQKLLDAWTDKEIHAGGVIDDHVGQQMEQAQIYLFLVSSAFIQSNYCFEKEFARACERQRAGEALIVPIIIRECDWKIPELRKFKALPEDGKPVVSRHWHSADEAFANVAAGLRALIEAGTFSKSKQRKAAKPAKEKFIPDERHVTEDQRAELRKVADEIVDRLIARAANESDDEVRKKRGRNFGLVWSEFGKHFNITDYGLPSLPRDRFDDAKTWLMQYRASKNKNYKRINPEKYRKTLTTPIYTIAGKLGWTDPELYAFITEKLELEAPITGLSGLGISQLELARDRVRYENTKRKVKANQSKTRKRTNIKAEPQDVVTYLLDNLSKARKTAAANGCANNLRQINVAKNQWALENGKTIHDTPTLEDLLPYLKKGVFPKCPLGGSYTINALKNVPTCVVVGHYLH